MPDFLVQTVAKLAPILHHVPLDMPGQMLLTMQSAAAAGILYGLWLPVEGMAPVHLTCGDSGKDLVWNAKAGLAGACPLPLRIALLEKLGGAPPRLTHSNVLALAKEAVPQAPAIATVLQSGKEEDLEMPEDPPDA